MKTFKTLLALLSFTVASQAQNTITPPENMVTENIPSLPLTLVEEVRNYTEYRVPVSKHGTRQKSRCSSPPGLATAPRYMLSTCPAGFQFYSTIEFVKKFLLN